MIIFKRNFDLTNRLVGDNSLKDLSLKDMRKM